MAAPTRIFLNPGAVYGTGRERWTRAAAELERRLGTLEVEDTRAPGDMKERVRELVERGETRFVAAGGDGTVNLLVNAVMALPEGAGAGGVAIGAIGLGSSNDFHKPYGVGDTIEGMPAHVDFEAARERDVIEVEYEDEGGIAATHFALVNASIGVTAEANARFNDPNWLVKAARPFSIDAAITAAVVVTLAGWTDVTCALSTDGAEPEMASVTNLGVFKSPHFGGALCYDSRVGPDDGMLGVALCEGMTALEIVRTLSALRRASFSGRPKTRSWTARSVMFGADRAFALEMDGEVVRARSAKFGVAPRRVRCCG
jgi:diacylglycerol kinase family enzyme